MKNNLVEDFKETWLKNFKNQIEEDKDKIDVDLEELKDDVNEIEDKHLDEFIIPENEIIDYWKNFLIVNKIIF